MPCMADRLHVAHLALFRVALRLVPGFMLSIRTCRAESFGRRGALAVSALSGCAGHTVTAGCEGHVGIHIVRASGEDVR